MTARLLHDPPGRLYGVGVGPGDSELVTVKAARLIADADVVAYHSGTTRQSIARRIAAPYMSPGVVEELLAYPVTTGATEHPLGYYGVIGEFYDACAQRLAVHLDAGRDVVVLAEGDPMFYGSYMYLHDRLAPSYEAHVVPGVSSVGAATSVLGTGLCRHEDVLTVLPGTLPVPELARRLADTQAAVVLKLGRTFPNVREALRQAGRLEDAWYVERATSERGRWMRVAQVDEATVPYMSMVVVTGSDLRSDAAGRAKEMVLGIESPDGLAVLDDLSAIEPSNGEHAEPPAELIVVGLGPGSQGWLTPEATQALSQVRHVVGYGPYVERVPQRDGLTRHASGNTVEVDRARLALNLALRGEAVAVVSGGDAGVFGMASAVFEAADDPSHPHYAAVPIRVIPGVTAAQAVASRAGAPLGGDYAVISLSDRLKPWPVVEARLRAASQADLVIALYNPASRTRTGQIAAAREVLLSERTPDTVVVVGRDIGRPGEDLSVTTLGDLDPRTIDMSCLILVGARGTRVSAQGRVWTPRFVPASHS